LLDEDEAIEQIFARIDYDAGDYPTKRTRGQLTGVIPPQDVPDYVEFWKERLR
jgi:hypothetical protein